MAEKVGPGSSNQEVLAYVQRRAMEVFELRVEDREAHYAYLKRIVLKSASEAGAPEPAAEEFAGKLDEWTRALVRLMEQGGAPASAQHQ